MMAAVFATMFLALVLGWLGRRTSAIVALAACLVLSIWLFLFEIYSPDYGFRMPWIKTEFLRIPAAGA
jgi:predicted acyltransferase